MGKIILEFDSIEESHDALTAVNAMRWKMSMWDLDQEFRKTTKYGGSILDPSKEATQEEIVVIEKCRELIRSILNNNGLSLED
jgi:hypothetical protein